MELAHTMSLEALRAAYRTLVGADPGKRRRKTLLAAVERAMFVGGAS